MGPTRSGVLASLGGLGLVGCTIATMDPHGSRGETERAYRGAVPVVFTNATPDRMCGLYMSFDDADAYGDNWLPAAGLAPGKSVEFRVRNGTYKARWDTCRPATKATPYYAATLYRERSVAVAEPTQLFAYVPSAVAPTTLAPPRWELKLVRFEGQPIDQDPVAYAKRYLATAPSHQPRGALVEPPVARYLCRFCVSGAPSGIETPFAEPLVEVPRFDMSEFVDHQAIAGPPRTVPGTRRIRIEPSLGRGHDVTQARANYRPR